MTLRTANRVRDTTTTTGTGTLTVTGVAPTGYIPFTSIPSVATNDTYLILIAHQTANEWEICLGTHASGTTISRGTPEASSNGGAAVSFSAGTKDVVLIQTAGREVLNTSIQVPLVIGGDAASSTLVLQSTGGAGTSDAIIWKTGSQVEAGRVDTNQNVIFSTAALAQNATNGFIYGPSCAGVPSGTPTSLTGRVPQVFDTTNQTKYYYSGGVWVPASGMQLIKSGSAGSAATFDIVYPSNYANFKYLKLLMALSPLTDATDLLMRTSSNAGSSYDAAAANYQYAGQVMPASGSVAAIQSNSATSMQLCTNISGDGSQRIRAEITSYVGDGSFRGHFYWSGTVGIGGGNFSTFQGGGERDTAAVVNAVRFLQSSGNILGDYRLYGLW